MVIVEEEWGWVEEITLSYVVVRLWDDRRMVLPSTYFTKTPFQNWTRHSSELLGAVELDVDWRVDVEGMRAELDRILDGTELWDGRTKVLQVTEAVAGLVRVRALVTATDAARLWDLRCHVREELVTWVQVRDGDGLPRQRIEVVEHEERRSRPRRSRPATGRASSPATPPARHARRASARGSRRTRRWMLHTTLVTGRRGVRPAFRDSVESRCDKPETTARRGALHPRRRARRRPTP